jgi:hypothetical protein
MANSSPKESNLKEWIIGRYNNTHHLSQFNIHNQSPINTVCFGLNTSPTSGMYHQLKTFLMKNSFNSY